MRPLLTLLLLAPLAAPAETVYEAQGVTVRLEELPGSSPDLRSFRAQVEDAKVCFRAVSGPFGRSQHGLKTALSQAFAQDGYLFVPVSCGGGNASKCQGFQAFAIQGGLRWLGNITGRWNGSKTLVYEKGVFYDTGDMLEINDLLSHAASPRYAMAYTENKGLRFDPDRTWALNADAFAQAGPDAPGLLYRAGLAKLCGKKKELAQALRGAKALSPAEQKAFARSLGQVSPKAVKPNPFLPVEPCAPDRA